MKPRTAIQQARAHLREHYSNQVFIIDRFGKSHKVETIGSKWITFYRWTKNSSIHVVLTLDEVSKTFQQTENEPYKLDW